MSSAASTATIATVRDGSAWNGDAKAQMAALDALLAGQVPLAEATQIPDGIRAYVERKQSGVNPLKTVADEALGDSDEAAAERCRRLLRSWAKDVGIDRVRWITKAEGNREDGVAAYAAYEADDLLRLMILIRHKHRDEPEWDPGTPDEFAAGMLLRQSQDMSMGYHARGMFGSSWKEYARLSQAAQGKFEGLVMRMVTLGQARRAAQVAAFNRKFDDRPIPTTKAEADQLMADMISEVIGRPVESLAAGSPASDPEPAQVHEVPADDEGSGVSEAALALTPETAATTQAIDPGEVAGRSYGEVIEGVKGSLTGDFAHDGALLTSVAQSCGDHPQAREIRRELGRMLADMAPDDVKAKFVQITEGYEEGFEPGLAEARAQMRAGNFTGARVLLEGLIGRYGAGTGLFLDDSVSEYRHFANDFEVGLYVRLYPSTKHLRKLPQDRAALYTDYGAVLLELRDADGASAALQEALRVNPVSTDAMFELGEVMKLTGRKREFRELTLRALVVAHSLATLARAYRNLGYLAVEDEDFDLAVACYCMSLAIDRDHAQTAQSELFYIQQVTGRTLDLPDRQAVEAKLARSGIQVGPSPLVRQLMDSAA
jgi:tetratricopeptide (TPR) repeat protein